MNANKTGKFACRRSGFEKRLSRDPRPESKRGLVRIAGAVAFVLVTVIGHFELADAGLPAAICGDATGDGQIKSGDALVTLHVAVGIGECVPPRCDANHSGSVTSADAMMILKTAVGQQIVLNCPSQASTSTTTSTTSTSSTSTTTTSLMPTCGNGVVEPGEDCEEGFCRGGCNFVTRICVDLLCSQDCTCPEPRCGDAILDAGEGCDPPGSACEVGICSANCGCLP